MIKKRLTAVALFMAFLCVVSGILSCTTVKPLCRHTVLAQYAALIDAGYEAEIWQLKNPKPVKGFKFHAAVRAKKADGVWLWAEQPDATFRLTKNQPPGMIMRRLK